MRLKLRGVVDTLAERFEAVFERSPAPNASATSVAPPPQGTTHGASAAPMPAFLTDLLAGAEDEIDRLFS